MVNYWEYRICTNETSFFWKRFKLADYDKDGVINLNIILKILKLMMV
jgi:hypothetical protein